MKKFICTICLFLALILVAAPILVSAADPVINVNDGVYVPFWSPKWVTGNGIPGMWKGYYVKKETNTLKTDLIDNGGGRWTIPGETYATVWEGLNALMPSLTVDVGYLFTCPANAKVEFTFAGTTRAQSTGVLFTVYKNSFTTKIYPENKANILMPAGQETRSNFTLDLKKDDKIFFNFASGEDEYSDEVKINEFSAVFRSLETNSSTSSQPSTSSSSTSQSSSSKSSSNSASTTTSSSSSQSGGIIIDDDNSPVIQSKFEDIKVDIEGAKMTLSKKLTVGDLMSSFTLKEDHTIKLYFKDGSLVKDNNLIVTDQMALKLYNQGTPINVFKLEIKFKNAVSNTPIEKGSPLVIIIIIAGALVAGGLAFYFLVLKKKIIK